MDRINRSEFLKRLGMMTASGIMMPLAGCQRAVNQLPVNAQKKSGNKFYVDSVNGNDSYEGTSPQTAWQTLKQASSKNYTAGDTLFPRSGATYKGTLGLDGIEGTSKKTFDVTSYGNSSAPVIDSSGYLAGIYIKDSKFVTISNLEITSDAGTLVDHSAKKKRFGVLIEAASPGQYSHIALNNLHIHDIFANIEVKSNGKNPTSNKGMGILALSNARSGSFLSHISIHNCTIRRTGFTGIAVHDHSRPGVNNYSTRHVEIINNTLSEIGGPGMNLNNAQDILVRSNIVDGSGSSVDSRMHGRGSGIWPWTCDSILIEHNEFKHARGKSDSCGAHIDFNNKNVVIQYNLSLDNAGGFIEILGNTYNSCYRYNISINDGWRRKGIDGARKDGRIIWLSNFTGKHGQKRGPYNSYIYNNTIYVKKNQLAVFRIMDTAKGFFIANNIFDIQGETSVLISPSVMARKINMIDRNVYHANNMNGLSRLDNHPIVLGKMGFENPGGLQMKDYIPEKGSLTREKGRRVTKLSDDSIGIKIGMKVSKDILGNRVTGIPDLGAVEYS